MQQCEFNFHKSLVEMKESKNLRRVLKKIGKNKLNYFKVKIAEKLLLTIYFLYNKTC